MKRFNLSVLFLTTYLCGCSHYYYVANKQNVPMLREKNDLRISGSFGGWDESKCIELQTAYSVADKVGILADFITAWGGDVSERDYGKGSYFDGAIGYYTPFREIWVFEIYGGLGGSTQHHDYSGFHYDPGTGSTSNQYSGYSDLSFLNLFIQPSVGVTFSVFEAAISTRICRLSYTNIDNYTNGSVNITEELNDIEDKSHYFLEPAITLRGGWKNIKAEVQIVYTGYLNSPQLYFYEDAHLSGGLYFTIPLKKK